MKYYRSKKLHWSYSIPLWYWFGVLLPLGVILSIGTIIGFMFLITS